MKLSREETLQIGGIAGMMKVICTTTPKEELRLILALMGTESYHAILDIYQEFTENPRVASKLAEPATKILKQELLLHKMEEGDLKADETSLDQFKGLITNAGKND